MRNRRQKTEPVPVWSAFCESIGTRCTFVHASGERCENGVRKGDRCEEHPHPEPLHVIKIGISASDFRDMQDHISNGRPGHALVAVRELIAILGERSGGAR